ncbi:MAG: 3-deoxy-7-phosphoheptulonate synthase, partial [bacterium]
GKEGLKFLAEAKEVTGLPVVTEVLSPEYLDDVAEVADILQVGSRNMQNFPLLKRVGKAKKPVLLKRGMMATIEEFLLAAEYIAAEGNPNIILCERGIRTFETSTRNTLDISAVPLIQQMSHLPVIADPSHASGRRSLIEPLAKASLAAGADGLMIEVHPEPAKALSDGFESLNFSEFKSLVGGLRPLAAALKRPL